MSLLQQTATTALAYIEQQQCQHRQEKQIVQQHIAVQAVAGINLFPQHHFTAGFCTVQYH
jgi:hypothetical protein